MDIVSLGATGTNTHYDFDAPFTILSQGRDCGGGYAYFDDFTFSS